jgi:hypothetical protein
VYFGSFDRGNAVDFQNSALDEFVRQVGAQAAEAGAASGAKAAALQSELSRFIIENTTRLMREGLSVSEIQDALRAAAGTVPQTYAPDANESGGDYSEPLEPPVTVTEYYVPLEDAALAAFAKGEVDAAWFFARVKESPDSTPITMGEGIALIITEFGKNPVLRDAAGGGEVVAGPDGEAFMPEYLSVTDAEDYRFLICEPVLFKTAEEVRSITTLLESPDKKLFYHKANIKKLLKAGWLDGYDKREVKKEAAYIFGELWNEFVLLREVYRRAAKQQQGMAIITGYEGDHQH